MSFNDLDHDVSATFFPGKKKMTEGYNHGTQTWNVDFFSWNWSCRLICCLRG